MRVTTFKCCGVELVKHLNTNGNPAYGKQQQTIHEIFQSENIKTGITWTESKSALLLRIVRTS